MSNMANPLAPSPAALLHSQQLITVIREALTSAGSLTFARFMELALYAPGLGYYSAGAAKFGAAGDFVTAPEMSPLFAQCLARQMRQVLLETDGNILEIGAGSGRLAADLLSTLVQLDCLPKHYFILEVSGDLRERQQRWLHETVPQLAKHVTWLDQLPDTLISGVIIANEVLDAMPVHRFRLDDPPQEYGVIWEQESFDWCLLSPSTHLLQALTNLALDLPSGYVSEINLLIPPWLNSMSAILQRGLILLIDYGYPQHEYYHPERHDGTLKCHYRHQVHYDPLRLVGLQDITAHVDFTAVARAAIQAGLSVNGFTTQTQFLINCGVTELLATLPAAQQLQLTQQLKPLLFPSEMGEAIKIMALGKEFNEPLLGFRQFDQRHRL